eukprot:930971-Rhodomonas_salina.1
MSPVPSASYVDINFSKSHELMWTPKRKNARSISSLSIAPDPSSSKSSKMRLNLARCRSGLRYLLPSCLTIASRT